MKNAFVYGPSIHGHVSGNGWVKYNLIRSLGNLGYNAISIHFSSQDTLLREDISSEERAGESIKIEYMGVSNPVSWENAVATYQPEIIMTVGDPETSWFVPLVADCKALKLYYFITEAKTANRYIPHGNKYLDLNKVLDRYDVIIPATDVTLEALTEDLDIIQNVSSVITPPVWEWNTSKDKESEYRDSIGIEFDAKVHFCIANNNERKRLDQLLLYFRKNLLVKPCCKLVIHTSLKAADGYDVISISDRLGISSNIIVNTDTSIKAMEGIFSSADTFVNFPAAEGYGLPFHEALLIGKKVMHSDVSQIGRDCRILKDSFIDLVEAKHPYFHRVGNQVWYSIGSNPKVTRYGRNGDYTIDQIINRPRQFRERIMNTVNKFLSVSTAK